MSTKVVIGMANENLVSDLRSLLDELPDVEVSAVAADTGRLAEYVTRLEPDLVLLHDELGPEPATAVIRDLTIRHPASAIIQVSPERSSSTVIRALEAGARGVVAFPFAFEDFSSRVQDALDWSRQMHSILEGAAAAAQRERGTVLTFVGAKGGVGVTTMALHLAIDHHANHPRSRVCVVDLDIEKGDVSALLDVRQSVSVADLAKVYHDLSATTVSDAVIEHESGIHVLLAPIDVRQSEAVTPEALRAIVALLRRDFDLIILDAGGYVSPAQGAAIELSDDTVVVTTPDVLTLRAMRKRILAWEALGVRHEAELRVLVNKVDRSSIFPADAVPKLTTAAVLGSHIPLLTRVLEPAVNERDPQAVADTNWWKLMARVRTELATIGAQPTARRAIAPLSDPEPAEPGKRRRFSLRRSKEAGAITLENVAVIPMALGIAVVMWQVAVLGLGALWLGQASTEATRSYAISGNITQATQAARSTIPEPFSSGVAVSGGSGTVRVTLHLPPGMSLLPSISSTHTVVQEPS
ncbi:MAG: AAA family ATPase [Propioniciclava sp.]|uniref:AAA family ATPase n=1 Tax=Propioniciclava sp. TaxID=2038686 RepID=UPI0039E71CBC